MASSPVDTADLSRHARPGVGGTGATPDPGPQAALPATDADTGVGAAMGAGDDADQPPAQGPGPELQDLAAGLPLDPARYGQKAASLSQLAAMGAPTRPGFVLAESLVSRIPTGGAEEAAELIRAAAPRMRDGALFALRGSPADPAWGGPPTLLNLGVTGDRLPAIAERIGARAAQDLYRRVIQSFAAGAMDADPDAFEGLLHDALKDEGVATEDALSLDALQRLTDDFLEMVEDECGEPFPQDPTQQLTLGLEAMARAWSSRSARILRAARGGPETGGLAIIVQDMALGLGRDAAEGGALCGAGRASFRDARSGEKRLGGRWLPQAQGDDALAGLRPPRVVGAMERLKEGQRDRSLEELAPDLAERLAEIGSAVERDRGEACELEFTVEQGEIFILAAAPMRRGARASVRIAVDLARMGAISREDALLRVEPRVLSELLHPTLDPYARRNVIARGLAASPGAASGPIVFTPEAAAAAAARGAPAILVRIETSPEDIRGMHAAAGILTVRGGMTSHAAVVARGLGAPGVVGASELVLDLEARTLTAPGGLTFGEGDPITIDGSAGEVMAGAVATIQPEESGALAELMAWADDSRRMRVRANADTAQDSRVSLRFMADGIGLCRTEHMFFEDGRITPMRRMILADTEVIRREALAVLLPMQRGDFAEIFRTMAGRPVTIRLLDPPLHEFLPHGKAERQELAEATGLTLQQIDRRIADMAEFNPMLGMRGCRLGVTMPEIYEMQARAIFEALAETIDEAGEQLVRPEVMIPLVSARREAAMLRAVIDTVAAAVAKESGREFDYRVGVMVETPRAALRAGDVAEDVDFMSFGTNDLTQMTYGLSRDDAGRFMREYVNRGVFAEDPFHTLDLEGVGELLMIAAERARAHVPDMSLGICGEHGGDPASIRFCELAGFDYVSCSPFRVPIARLAAAQATILARRAGVSGPRAGDAPSEAGGAGGAVPPIDFGA
ncbi:pyruvate, phosphate dikinase [Rhodovulum sp. DZ06]|uniref:pyruvate, phosphate dikinase n=1 Tax=Rhodovulum sp. DZ06 TaxID=3425126 RepID=UPI003D32B1B7